MPIISNCSIERLRHQVIGSLSHRGRPWGRRGGGGERGGGVPLASRQSRVSYSLVGIASALQRRKRRLSGIFFANQIDPRPATHAQAERMQRDHLSSRDHTRPSQYPNLLETTPASIDESITATREIVGNRLISCGTACFARIRIASRRCSSCIFPRSRKGANSQRKRESRDIR